VTELAGRVALGVSKLSFDPERDREADLATLRAGLDAGATIIDTARAYARADDTYYGERLAADAVAGRDVLVATKGGHSRISQDDWDVDLSPERVRADVEGSLEALRTERIGLYFIHRVDLGLAAGQPLEPAVATLAELRYQGKLARLGLSNVTVADLEAASAVTTIDVVENRHSAIGKQSPEVLAWCEAHDVPFFAYSPMPRGAATPNLSAIAAEREVSVQRLLLRALLASSPVLTVITGATRIPSVLDSVAAQTMAWDDELEAAYRADLALDATDAPAAR
jgi:aryl-alcohol dehydrogenase-like predicted oxidoreductase